MQSQRYKITPKEQWLSLCMATFTKNWIQLSELIRDSLSGGYSFQTENSGMCM